MSNSRQKSSSSTLLFHSLKHRFVLQPKHISNSKRILMIQHQIIEKLFPKMLILGQRLEKRQRFESPSISSTLATTIADPSSCHNPSTHRFHFSLLNEVNPSYHRIFIEDLAIHDPAQHMREIRVNMKQTALEKAQQLILAREDSWQHQHKRIWLRHKGRKHFIGKIDRLTALFVILKMKQDVVNLMRFVLRQRQLTLKMQLKHRILHFLHQTLPLTLGLSSLSLDCTNCLAIDTVSTLLWLEMVYFAIRAGHYFRPLQIFKVVLGDLAGTMLIHIVNEFADDLKVVNCVCARCDKHQHSLNQGKMYLEGSLWLALKFRTVVLDLLSLQGSNAGKGFVCLLHVMMLY